MNIEFINHASYIIESGSTRLLSDPWIEGRIFNNGWDLLLPTQFGYDDFASITHIWFSHEHPDHFFPPNIGKIPEKHRNNITVLFQETIDKKVVQYCQKMGFKKVIELPPDTDVKIGDDFHLMCTPWRDGDSYLRLRTQDEVLLNINDCIILTEDEIRSVAKKVGKVDLLLTQFSLSAWDGNPEDIERRKAGAKIMLDRIIRQSQIFEARYVIPFASYVWFCHEENYFINSEANSIELIEREILAQTDAIPIVMAPTDSWKLGEAFDNAPAIALYNAAVESLPTREKSTSPVVPETELQSTAREFCQKLTAKSGLLRMRISYARLTFARRQRKSSNSIGAKLNNALRLAMLDIEPAVVYVHDLNQAYTFDLVNALRPVDLPKEKCDIVLGSDSLHYAFRFLWGGESLLINGRFTEVYPEGKAPLFNYFFTATGQSKGDEVTWKSIPASAISKLLDKDSENQTVVSP